MDFKISTSGYNVVSSGSVILYGADSELRLSVVASKTFSFEIILEFIKNDEKEQNLSKAVEENTITFKCINFNNSLGTGTVEPLSIATIGGKKLFLHFWSYLMGDASVRKVEYTFLEKE